MKELTKATYPFNLAKAIFQNDEEALAIYLPGIEQALATLTERETRVLRLRFNELYTLQKAGEEIGITRERVRQIEAKAIRKLRHPTRRVLFKAVPYTEVIAFWNDNDVLSKHISELGMSVRSTKCLLRVGKDTLGKVSEMTIDELKKVRNLGLKSMNEVMDHLVSYGLSLKAERNE